MILRSLDEISTDYERAELTLLWLHDNSTKQHHLLFAVVELCPVEQQASTPILSDDGHRMKRASLGTGRALYVSRAEMDVAEALAFFRGPARHFAVPHGTPFEVQAASKLSDEPPDECPLLADPERKSLLAVLPRRKTQLRVLSKFDINRSAHNWLSSTELTKVENFARDTLGIDLALFPEHIGAIHLCFSNPLARSFHERLSDGGKELLFEAHARRGKSLTGCILELIDERPGGVGFHLRHELTDRVAVIPLPAEPVRLRTLLFAPGDRNECLADHGAHFVKSFHMHMEIGTARRLLSAKQPDGTIENREVPVVSSDFAGRGHQEVPTVRKSLADAERHRELQALRDNGTFFYFPGGPESRLEAREILRARLMNVRNRCLICDPYLAAQDVADFVPFVRRARLEVRLLTSASFLSSEHDTESTQGAALKSMIVSLMSQDSTLNITCRVLRGKNKSPVHDRYLLLDDDVYLAGSSLNEFGSRATTLFRSPAPELLRAELEKWWDAKAGETTSLDDFLARKTSQAGEGP